MVRESRIWTHMVKFVFETPVFLSFGYHRVSFTWEIFWLCAVGEQRSRENSRLQVYVLFNRTLDLLCTILKTLRAARAQFSLSSDFEWITSEFLFPEKRLIYVFTVYAEEWQNLFLQSFSTSRCGQVAMVNGECFFSTKPKSYLFNFCAKQDLAEKKRNDEDEFDINFRFANWTNLLHIGLFYHVLRFNFLLSGFLYNFVNKIDIMIKIDRKKWTGFNGFKWKT